VRLREAGGEFGSVTGRPRRCGWLDFPALRYAARVNGLTDLIVTKLDVLSGFTEIPVCVGYDTPDGRTHSLPIEDIDKATPIYESMPGWGRPLDQIRSLADLPTETRRYLDRIEKETSVPLAMVSVGPEREATMILRNFF
jgi:adenylosuccinate synthase